MEALKSSDTPKPGALSGVRSQEGTNVAPRAKGISAMQLTDARARYIATVAQRIPRTPEGHLAAILRTDIIPPDITPVPTQSGGLPALLEEAYVPLNYDEGFPALPNGRPVWFRLEHEPAEMFAAFEVYTDLIDVGPRHIASLLENKELQALLGDSLTLDTLRNAYYMYFWKDRALAHDLFQDAAYRHIRIRRALSTEDKSYQLATKMLNKLETVFDKDDFWEIIENDPALALSYLEKLTRIQRISAGMPAAAPQGEGEGGSTSFEMIMRRVQQDATGGGARGLGSDPGVHGESMGFGGRAPGSMVDESGRLIADNAQFMRGALHDPKTSKMMQEVIIRMTESRGATKQPRWASRVGTERDPNEPDAESGSDINQVPSEFQGLVGRSDGGSNPGDGSSEP